MPEENMKTVKLQKLLCDEKPWRRHAYNEIKAIPSGYLASYGRIASLVGQKTGHNPGARSVAWLRRELYKILTHQTKVPLHRVAKAGDIHSLADSDDTKDFNDTIREQEGFFTDPKWI